MAPFLTRNYSILVNEICSFCLVLWKSLLGFLHASLTLYDAIIMALMVSFYLTLSARYVGSDLNFLYSKAFIFWWGLSCHRKVIHLNLFGRILSRAGLSHLDGRLDSICGLHVLGGDKF